jgi:hypothetical protein
MERESSELTFHDLVAGRAMVLIATTGGRKEGTRKEGT